jgi:steroid delta-isomerase-like uncharacterized protein
MPDREQLVRDHVELENAGDYAGVIETFKHPRYEYVATDEVYDGAEEVLDHFEELHRAFPDQLIEIITMHTAEEAILIEAVARGTHTGPLRGLPPTGKRFEQQFLGIFVFEDDGLVCERVYYDAATVLQQLGIARDPLSLTGGVEMLASHPFTIGRGVVRRVMGR